MVASASSYQGGPFVEAFSSSGSNPLVNCKLSGEKGVQKVYEKTVKGYVYTLTGAASKLQLPKDERKSPLHFLQQFLVLQIYAPAGQHFAIELGVTDSSGSKRKLYFSTAFHEVKTTPLHCQVPLTALERDVWLNLAFDLVDLFGACFRGLTYRSLDVLVLGSVCRLRKIFTLRQQPIDSADPSFVGEPVPSSLDYPTGVQYKNQVLNASRIRGALAETASAKRLSSEDPLSTKGGAKRLSGSTHVAFGSRTAVPPAPLIVVPSNVDLSHRSGGVEAPQGAVKKGEKSERLPSSRKASAQELKAPKRNGHVASAEEDDAGEEWSPTERSSEPEAPASKRRVPGKAEMSKTGAPNAVAPSGKAGKAGNVPGPSKKEAAKKLPVRAESPVTAWGDGAGTETPEETLLASMSADWKQAKKLERGQMSAQRDKSFPLEQSPKETADDSRSSRGSSRRTVRFSEEGEALSRVETPLSEPKVGEPSENRAPRDASPRERGLEARDVLAELEKELAGLTAGTRNSPRAELWRSKTDGFSRRSSVRGSGDEAKTAEVQPSFDLVGREQEEFGGVDERETMREEKLLAVAAMEEWDEARRDEGVNGRLEDDVVNEPWESASRRRDLTGRSGGLEADAIEEDGVNERFGGEAGVNEHMGRDTAVNERSEEEGGVNARFGEDGGVNKHSETGVIEHFEVHHEAASSGRASEDTWRSRRSNSRYSQESDDSDVTPRASQERVRRDDWNAQKGEGAGSQRNSPLSKESGGWGRVSGDLRSSEERKGERISAGLRGSRSLVTEEQEESERLFRGSGMAKALGAEKRPPSIDWEAEDDVRSSLGSLEGSEGGPSLSAERRSFRGLSGRRRTSNSRSGHGGNDRAADVSGSLTRGSSRSSLRESLAPRVSNRSGPRSSRDPRQPAGLDPASRAKRTGNVSRRTSEVETSLSEWTAAADVSPSADTVPADVTNPAAQENNPRSRPASIAALNLTMRPEDMDLLFDPILKCFYDPKSNKYYDLKDEDDSLI